MSTIPTSVTEEQFEQPIRPSLKTAQRGYECKIALYKVFNYLLKRLHIGCPWSALPIAADANDPEKRNSWQDVYYHWQKWNAAGCFEQIWQQSLKHIKDELDCTHLNLDGSHAIAKKEVKVSSINLGNGPRPLISSPLPNANGFILASTRLVAGNHHDAFNLKANLQTAFKSIKRLGISIVAAFFNADSAFDTRAARTVCFNHGLIPNMDANKRNQKRIKRGRPRLFDKAIYNKRFSSERTFAGIDSHHADLGYLQSWEQ